MLFSPSNSPYHQPLSASAHFTIEGQGIHSTLPGGGFSIGVGPFIYHQSSLVTPNLAQTPSNTPPIYQTYSTQYFSIAPQEISTAPQSEYVLTSPVSYNQDAYVPLQQPPIQTQDTGQFQAYQVNNNPSQTQFYAPSPQMQSSPGPAPIEVAGVVSQAQYPYQNLLQSYYPANLTEEKKQIYDNVMTHLKSKTEISIYQSIHKGLSFLSSISSATAKNNAVNFGNECHKILMSSRQDDAKVKQLNLIANNVLFEIAFELNSDIRGKHDLNNIKQVVEDIGKFDLPDLDKKRLTWYYLDLNQEYIKNDATSYEHDDFLKKARASLSNRIISSDAIRPRGIPSAAITSGSGDASAYFAAATDAPPPPPRPRPAAGASAAAASAAAAATAARPHAPDAAPAAAAARPHTPAAAAARPHTPAAAAALGEASHVTAASAGVPVTSYSDALPTDDELKEKFIESFQKNYNIELHEDVFNDRIKRLKHKHRESESFDTNQAISDEMKRPMPPKEMENKTDDSNNLDQQSSCDDKKPLITLKLTTQKRDNSYGRLAGYKRKEVSSSREELIFLGHAENKYNEYYKEFFERLLYIKKHEKSLFHQSETDINYNKALSDENYLKSLIGTKADQSHDQRLNELNKLNQKFTESEFNQIEQKAEKLARLKMKMGKESDKDKNKDFKMVSVVKSEDEGDKKFNIKFYYPENNDFVRVCIGGDYYAKFKFKNNEIVHEGFEKKSDQQYSACSDRALIAHANNCKFDISVISEPITNSDTKSLKQTVFSFNGLDPLSKFIRREVNNKKLLFDLGQEIKISPNQIRDEERDINNAINVSRSPSERSSFVRHNRFYRENKDEIRKFEVVSSDKDLQGYITGVKVSGSGAYIKTSSKPVDREI